MKNRKGGIIGENTSNCVIGNECFQRLDGSEMSGADKLNPSAAAGLTIEVNEALARQPAMGHLAERVFAKYDKDGDGGIDITELKNLCMELGAFLSDNELDLALRAMDVDGDGKIDFDEFRAWWDHEDRFERLRHNEMELAFLNSALTSYISFDVNHDGVISRDEFATLHRVLKDSGYNVHDEQHDWDMMDTDKNGSICYSEYVDWLIASAHSA